MEVVRVISVGIKNFSLRRDSIDFSTKYGIVGIGDFRLVRKNNRLQASFAIIRIFEGIRSFSIFDCLLTDLIKGVIGFLDRFSLKRVSRSDIPFAVIRIVIGNLQLFFTMG